MKKIPVLLGAALCAGLAVPAMAGDAANGAKLFEGYCSDCHTTARGGGNNKGPNLFGLVGRKTGSIADFDYSDANRTANWVWTPQQLDIYLMAPRQVMVGTKMKFKGIPDNKERADVIAYLESLK
jgi:cytochrome c